MLNSNDYINYMLRLHLEQRISHLSGDFYELP